MPPIPAMQEAAHELIAEQCQRIAIPKRFTMPIREIWDMQERLPRRRANAPTCCWKTRASAPATTSCCCVKALAKQTDGLGEWWTDYQDANDSERRDMIRDLSSKPDDAGECPRKRRRSSSGKRKRAGVDRRSGSNTRDATRLPRHWAATWPTRPNSCAEPRGHGPLPQSRLVAVFPPSMPATRCCRANRATPTPWRRSTASLPRSSCSTRCKPSKTIRAASACERWGPRTLDLDILLFGDRVMDEPRLKVPHYQMQVRAFVLYPLAETGAGAHPGDGRELHDLLAQCPFEGLERLPS